MNKLPDTIDVGPALKKLAERYPDEQVKLSVCWNESDYGGSRFGLRFDASVGNYNDMVNEFSGSEPMGIVDKLIAKAGPRDPLAKIRTQIDKASLDLANAKEALRLEEEKLNEQHGTIVLNISQPTEQIVKEV